MTQASPDIATDRKGRPYRRLGKFMGHVLQVYISPKAKGQRRQETARIVLAGSPVELRANVQPWRAERICKQEALLELWAVMVRLVDARKAAKAAADEMEAAMAAEGIKIPPGPLHRPGLPAKARAILECRSMWPAASHRMIAAHVQCNPARVCQVLRKHGDPAANPPEAGAEPRAECALNIQREFSADSARGAVQETHSCPGETPKNEVLPGRQFSAPPMYTSSSKEEDDTGLRRQTPTDRGRLGGRRSPSSAGTHGETPRGSEQEHQSAHGTAMTAADAGMCKPGHPLAWVPDDSFTACCAVVLATARGVPATIANMAKDLPTSLTKQNKPLFVAAEGRRLIDRLRGSEGIALNEWRLISPQLAEVAHKMRQELERRAMAEAG